MNTVQNGLRSYGNHDIARQAKASAHHLDILADMVSDVKSEARQRESDRRQPRAMNAKESREDFRDILKRELAR